jgi:hypothetical protein
MVLRQIYDADLSLYTYIIGCEKTGEAIVIGPERDVDRYLRNRPRPETERCRRGPGGPAVLGRMPELRQLTIDDVIGLLDDPTLVVLDTRADRAAFMKAHLRGSPYAPAKGSFTDFAGSYLRPKERIVLVVDSGDQVEEQVRRPIRIGFDKVEGWLCVAALASTNGALASIRSVKLRELPALIAEDPDILVLDVRRRLGLQCSLW